MAREKSSRIIRIPKIILPEGYSVRPAKADKKGNMCKKDKEAWDYIQRSALSPKTRKKRLSVKTAEGVFFADFKDEIVACVYVMPVSKIEVSFEYGITLEGHRRKGLYKALMVIGLEYVLKKKVKWIHFVPAKFLMPFWKRLGFYRKKRGEPDL